MKSVLRGQYSQRLSNEYNILGLLGRGGFGVVYTALRKTDGLKVAIKEVAKEKAAVTEDNIPMEAVLLRLLVDVPGVVRILNHIESKKSFYIIMECFSCMDLYDFISERGTLSENLARYLTIYSWETKQPPKYKFQGNFPTTFGNYQRVSQERCFSQWYKRREHSHWQRFR